MFAVKPRHHPKAGIGHQVFSWMGSRLLSERAGADFYHTPFESPRSGGGWDGFFGFGEGFETDAPEPHENLPGFDLRESKNVEQAVSRIRSHSGTTRTGKNCFPGVLSSEMRGLVSNMQSSYQQLHGGAEGPECALHIRRGDIHPERNANRWIALNRYE